MVLVPTLAGLSAVAERYDALICDVWGVLHDGIVAHRHAAEALRRFRVDRGPIVLLSNSPRLPDGVDAQLRDFGIPADAYDAIVTSGGAVRARLTRDSQGRAPLKVLHIGPERDYPTFEGLNVALVDAQACELVLCTGPYRDEQQPGEYADLLGVLRGMAKPMVCANPDLVVQRGDVLHYCAGSIAKMYEAIGGEVIYFGKPYAPIYHEAMARLDRPASRTLAIGDALETDIRGANQFGIDALFIGGGIHGKDLNHIAQLLAATNTDAVAMMEQLRW